MLVLLAGWALGTGVPELINYQGILKDGAGDPITGAVTLTFRFYDADTAGNLLLTVQQPNVSVNQGLYNVLIGSGVVSGPENTLSELFRDNADLWMSVEVGTDGEMAPRHRIASVPYALHGGEWSDEGTYIHANNAQNVVVTDDAKVGIGTTSPAEALTFDGGILQQGSAAYGAWSHTHVNLGRQSDTGEPGEDHRNCTVSGGSHNTASSSGASIGGGVGNVAGQYGTVNGGFENTASDFYPTVGGGQWNEATGHLATVGGGELNSAVALRSTVGGGGNNLAYEDHSTVSGGYDNLAAGFGSTVAGGIQNAAGLFVVPGDSYATVSGGYANTASGLYATVPGGEGNLAEGYCSFAAGCNMQLSHDADGTFVWGYSDTAITPIDTPDAFIIYSGDVGIGTTTPNAKLDVNGDANVSGEATMTSASITTFAKLTPMATPPASPSEGTVYMDSMTHKLMVYDGTSWQACW